MIENFEFGDTKQVRKTLLLTSLIGLLLKNLIKHSTGEFEFIGFKIPIEKASIIPEFVGYIIIYEIIVLIIRFSDEKLKEKFKKYEEYLEYNKPNTLHHQLKESMMKSSLPKESNVKLVKYSILLVDIIFPILFGIISLIRIFI
jgi:hypothetical protein